MEFTDKLITNQKPMAGFPALTWIVLLCVATLLSVTLLHWGGMYHHVAIWLYPLGGLLWLCVGIKAWQAQIRRKSLGGGMELAVIFFLIYAAWSFSISPAAYVARFEWLWILTYAGAFLGLRLVLHNRRWGIGLLVLLLLLATIVCIFALMNKGVDQHLIWGLPRPDYGDRISGTFGCPNHFGNFMVMACCIAVALSVYPRNPWALRIISLYLMAMFSVGLFFSVSRGSYLAWLAGLFVIGCFFILQRGFDIKWRLILLTVCLLISSGFLYCAFQNPFVKSRIDSTWKGDIRLQLAQDALKIWRAQPLRGSGMATFDFEHQRVHDTYLTSRAVYTHNDYLNLLADYGLIGTGLVLIFFLLILIHLIRRLRSSERNYDLLVTRTALWVITVMAVHSLFDFNFHIPACALTFFTILGLATSSPSKQGARQTSGFLPGSILGLAAVLAAAYLIYTPFILRESVALEALKEEAILKQTALELTALGEKAWQHDPACGPVLEKIGDGLRVKTAEINQYYKRALKSGDAVKAAELLREREALGQQTLLLYQRTAQANPLYDGILIKQGLLFDILDRDQEAYLFYTKAIQNQPHNVFYQYHLGFHLLKIGEYDLAKKQFLSAQQMPTHLNLDRDQKQAAEKALRILQEMGN
jgi:O-antigen ligase